MNAVVDIAGLFLQKNSVVVITQERDKKIEYKTNREPIDLGEIPVFILINNLTASAAEILAGCLQIHSDSDKSSTQIKKSARIFSWRQNIWQRFSARSNTNSTRLRSKSNNSSLLFT